MKSEVKLVGPNWKITATLGACATILIIVLSTIFRFEFGVILLMVASSVGLFGTVTVIAKGINTYYAVKLSRLEYDTKRQELRLVTYQADQAQLKSLVLNFPKTQRLVTLPNAGVRIIEALPDTYTALPATTDESIDLLTALDGVQRCLIVGNSDEGKTTLLQWIVARRMAVSKAAIIDPHSWPGKWQDGISVIGQGRDYLAIDKALTALVQLMTKRYDQIGRGEVAEMGHEPICVIVDEWRAITGNLDHAGDVIKTLLTESRKAAFSIFVASHSDRAKPLGLMGEYDLKDGFSVVRLSRSGDIFSATLDKGNGPIPVKLPGPYHVVRNEPLELEPEPTEQEQQVLDLLARGESYKNISEAAWGSGKYGKFYNDKIDQIRQKWGRS